MRWGTLRLVEKAIKQVVPNGVNQLSARGAHDEVAQLLGVGGGAPVLAGTHKWTDAHGHVVEFGGFFITADRGVAYSYARE
ncbi:MAG: UTRA domain-containing protein [Longispora sp.]|nr:UTRA domain-containing protein [Longispora sp. (in: high G+C Gram-positive bacteria)]